MVERGDRIDAVALRRCDDRSVDHAERQIEVLLHQLSNAFPVGLEYWLNHQLASSQ